NSRAACTSVSPTNRAAILDARLPAPRNSPSGPHRLEFLFPLRLCSPCVDAHSNDRQDDGGEHRNHRRSEHDLAAPRLAAPLWRRCDVDLLDDRALTRFVDLRYLELARQKLEHRLVILHL